MNRIIIAGGPRTGKTTAADALGEKLGIPVRHTDDLIGRLDWSASGAEVAKWLSEPGPWVIEGVAVGRALRKWFATNLGLPADRFVYLSTPHVRLTPGQETMAKGCATVWGEVSSDIIRRGGSIAQIATILEGARP